MHTIFIKIKKQIKTWIVYDGIKFAMLTVSLLWLSCLLQWFAFNHSVSLIFHFFTLGKKTVSLCNTCFCCCCCCFCLNSHFQYLNQWYSPCLESVLQKHLLALYHHINWNVNRKKLKIVENECYNIEMKLQ